MVTAGILHVRKSSIVTVWVHLKMLDQMAGLQPVVRSVYYQIHFCVGTRDRAVAGKQFNLLIYYGAPASYQHLHSGFGSCILKTVLLL